jgi:nicotinate phosphoribosyltransferase
VDGLLTDLYELTMAAGYYQAAIAGQRGTFELSVRRLPERRSFLLAAGLRQAVEYLLDGFRFGADDIEYLRTLPQFARVSPGFFETLRRLRFTGDLFAVPEGTPVFPGEPLAIVRGPMIEAQIPETYLLSTLAFQTLIATKAARITETAEGRGVVEFGTRRAHSPQAGVLAARAAYIGGAIGTSNVLAGKRFGIPVFGTAAHSWVQAFPSELQAQRELQRLLGEQSVFLVDTYDTMEGVRKAAGLGPPLWGVRIDSGDLASLSRAARAVLDEAGLRDAKIMASGDLDEYRIGELCAAGVPIDAFGVGTELATSADAPALAAIYKLVEIEVNGGKRYPAKFSVEKITVPGAKQVYRFADRDLIARADERIEADGAQPLLRPVIVGGRLVEPLPDVRAARDHAADCLRRLPERHRRLAGAEPYPVEYSRGLLELLEQARGRWEGVHA